MTRSFLSSSWLVKASVGLVSLFLLMLVSIEPRADWLALVQASMAMKLCRSFVVLVTRS